MKKSVMISLLLAVWIAVGYSAGICSSNAQSGAPGDGLIGRLPADAELVLKAGSIETLFQNFAVTGDTVFGKPVTEMAEMRQELGFNPLDVRELQRNGFATGKPVAIVLDDLELQKEEEKAVFTLGFLIPVNDAGKAVQVIRSYLQKKYPDTEFTSEGDVTRFLQADGTHGAMGSRDGYLYVGLNPRTTTVPFVTSAMAGKTSLAGSDTYQAVARKLDTGKELFLYANFVKLLAKNLETLKQLAQQPDEEGKMPAKNMARNLEYLKEYEGAGVSVDLGQHDFVASGILNIQPDADFLKVVRDVRYNRGIVMGVDLPPVLLLSTAVNAGAYYRTIQKNMTDADREKMELYRQQLQNTLGLDLEKDIVDNLSGDFNAAIYDGISINMTNYNALITIGVRNPEKAKAVVEKAFSALTPQQQGSVQTTTVAGTDAYMVTLFGMVQLYGGIRENTLVLALGKPLFEKALTGTVDKGFAAAANEPKFTDALKGEKGIFYLSIDELTKALKNFAFLLQQMKKEDMAAGSTLDAIAGAFDYILLTNHMAENTFHGNGFIKTAFTEPFFQGLEKLNRQLTPPEPTVSETPDAPAASEPGASVN